MSVCVCMCVRKFLVIKMYFKTMCFLLPMQYHINIITVHAKISLISFSRFTECFRSTAHFSAVYGQNIIKFGILVGQVLIFETFISFANKMADKQSI